MRGTLVHENEWVVVAYHFAGYSRLIGPAAAGFMRMPFRRWIVLDYIGAAPATCVRIDEHPLGLLRRKALVPEQDR